MGSGGELAEKSDKSTSPQDCLDYLDKLCAYALSVGMTYEQYWFQEPSLIRYYVQAEKIKQRKINSSMWLQGLYVYQAIGSLIHLANPFSKERRAKPYMKRPIPLTDEDKEEQEREKYERFVKYMHSLVKKEVKEK